MEQWLKANFDDIGLIAVEAALANFEAIVGRLRARSDAPILVYNLSSVVPGERCIAAWAWRTCCPRASGGSTWAGRAVAEDRNFGHRCGHDRRARRGRPVEDRHHPSDRRRLPRRGRRGRAGAGRTGRVRKGRRGGMSLSVVIRSKDEAARLRPDPGLAGAPDGPDEVVVVDDGSSRRNRRGAGRGRRAACR